MWKFTRKCKEDSFGDVSTEDWKTFPIRLFFGLDHYCLMVSALIISVKLDSCLACCSGSAKVHVACLRFLGLVTDYLFRVSLSLSIDYMTRQENNNTLLHDPINKRILRGLLHRILHPSSTWGKTWLTPLVLL